MKINNEFTVRAPVEQAWETMLDLERIAPCLPGAAIQEEKGDGEYDGTMKVKIGPITANYKGTVKFEETDEANYRVVLQATGRDARGQGTASATITSILQEEADKTRVSVETDMKLTGRAAQFGRGIAQDVATKMLTQFAECLEEEIAGGPSEGADAAPKETSAEQNGSRNGAEQASPGATLGGTAGRVLSSDDPTVMAGGTVEGAVVAGPGSQEASTSTADTGQTAAQQQRPRREQEAFDIGAASSSAILKRAAPVLAGVGVLAVLLLLFRRRR
jgi:carbon monoxide dehydrogenase subunit G